MTKDFGLIYKETDTRNFKFGAIFSLPKLEELIDFYVIETLGIKNQLNTDRCTAFGSTTVSEVQEVEPLDVDYQFAKIKQIMGGDPDEWGADIESTCKSFTEFGSLAIKDFSKLLLKEGNMRNGRIWEAFDSAAIKHKKKTYFEVNGPYDLFDNIRATLWKGRNEEYGAITGVTWRPQWPRRGDGIIPKQKYTGGFGHLVAIIGWKPIKGEPHLIIQNSYGKEWGDQGLNYFPREVVNREFKYGTFVFIDMPREEAEYQLQHGIKDTDGWFKRLLKSLFSWLL